MRKVIRFLAIVVIVGSMWQIMQYVLDYRAVDEQLESARGEELRDLQQQNPDIIGWLSLAGTRLDNPVLQTTDNDFYLTHDHLRQDSRGGSIYVDYRNEPLADRHTIFYGHVLRNETMFGGLHHFADAAYAREHASFLYETLDKTYVLEVFAAYETTTDVYYIETEFTDATYAQFLRDIEARSVIDIGTDVAVTDRIVTFSTCTTSADDDERFVVHAKVTEIK